MIVAAMLNVLLWEGLLLTEVARHHRDWYWSALMFVWAVCLGCNAILERNT